jgi:hypothetical protein
MKSIKHVLLAIISSLLLTAGFAKAAESFDVVGKSTVVQQTVNTNPTKPCSIDP